MRPSGDAMLALENELHRARVLINQLVAQRDFLLARLIDLEGTSWELPVESAASGQATSVSALAGVRRVSSGGAARKRARPAPTREVVADVTDRTGLCIAALNKSGKLCRRKATTNFSYCGYHLPLDPTSGFMYCTHVKPGEEENKRKGKDGLLKKGKTGGKSCGNPVPVNSDRLCKYHKVGGTIQAYQDDSDMDSDSD
jgi:hypothetical protein